jgi:electron transport complex protein RnfB
MVTVDVYEELIEWLKQYDEGLTHSDDMVALMKARYTPEDAALLTGIPIRYNAIEDLAELKGMSVEELQPRLDALARKGVVWKVFKYGKTRYRICDTYTIFYRSVYWGGGRNSEHYTMAPFLNRTFETYFERFADSHTKGLRTLPIETTVGDTRGILPFEDVLKVLDDQDYFCVGNCSCKAKHNLDPDHENCSHYPYEENCVHFGNFARYMVENGHGRELSREECRDVLLRCADEGMVHGVSNWLEPAVDTI